MFSFIADFNGDGRPDILVLGRVLHHQAFWYENPGAAEATKPDARWKNTSSPTAFSVKPRSSGISTATASPS